MKAIRYFSPLSISLLCLAIVLGVWCWSWRLDDQRDHPGWRTDAVRVISADWLSCSEAVQVRVTKLGGEPEDWDEGFTASTWQGLRGPLCGADSQEAIRHEVAMVALRDLIDGSEVWLAPAVPGRWQASVNDQGQRCVRIWVLSRGEWIDLEEWARKAWYTRESMENEVMVDEYVKTIGQVTESPTQFPPQVKPHPPSDPEQHGLCDLFDWLKTQPTLVAKLKHIKAAQDLMGS